VPYSFTPPSVQRGYNGPAVRGGGLFRRMKVSVGQSLLKKNGFYTLLFEPDSDDLTNSDLYYIGGYQYVVSDAEAADLIAAGYGAQLGPTDGTPPVDPGPVIGGDDALYGVGDYGEGIYGS
jgi:hypothetical protein